MAARSGVASSRRPLDGDAARSKRLKEKAVAFYQQHDVPGAVERLLNEMYLAEPKDVYGYMSEYFHKLSHEPSISRLAARETLDSGGRKAVEVSLHCTVNGVEKFISSVSVPLELHSACSELSSSASTASSPTKATNSKSQPPKGSKGAGKTGPAQPDPVTEETDLSPSVDYTPPIETIIDLIAPLLQGIPSRDQRAVDDALRTLTVDEQEKKGRRPPHPSSLVAASLAASMAASSLLHTPLFLHLANTFHPNGESKKFTLPVPVLSAIAGGSGKLRMREFSLTPLPGTTLPEQTKAVVSIYHALGRLLTGKSPSSATVMPLSGAFCPALDRPEQALDLLGDSARAVGLELDKDIGVIVDVGADRVYDVDKGKYEIVSGQWKSSEDVISLLTDLLQRYPGIVGYVDPLHHQDLEGWLKLSEGLGSRCLLVTACTLEGLPMKAVTSMVQGASKEGSIEEEQTPTSPPAGAEEGVGGGEEPRGLSYLSCSAFCPSSTLSRVVDIATHLNGHSHYLMLESPATSTSTMNTVIADLAVALQCRFLRLGAPIGLTSSGVLSRLLQIREELVSRGLYEPTKAHLFTSTPLDQ